MTISMFVDAPAADRSIILADMMPDIRLDIAL